MRNGQNPTSELRERSERSDRMATSFLDFLYFATQPILNTRHQLRGVILSIPCIYFPKIILQSHFNSISAHLDLKQRPLTISCDVTLAGLANIGSFLMHF